MLGTTMQDRAALALVEDGIRNRMGQPARRTGDLLKDRPLLVSGGWAAEGFG
jgi:hypothetical protein